MSNDYLDKLQSDLEAENRRFIQKCEEEKAFAQQLEEIKMKEEKPETERRSSPDGSKCCIDCVHSTFTSATGDYSEYTPGYPEQWNCSRGHWDFCEPDDQKKILRQLLRKAHDCPDYEYEP